MNLLEDRYVLMNKNTPVANLIVAYNKVYISKVLSDIPNYLGDINFWVESRMTLIGRENLKRMAKIAGISTEEEFLTISKAISINDTFWVNDLKSPTTWEKVNPYTNRLSRIMAEMAIEGLRVYENQNLRSPSPQYRIDGVVDKCVKREHGALYLYKTDGEKWSDLAGSRPYSEYYCSQLQEKLKFSNFVKYNLKVDKTDKGYYKPYVYSRLFTNEKIGLVQMGMSKFAGYSIHELDRVIPDTAKIQLREMVLLDSLTLNFDRHSGNYGFLVNNDNYKIVGLAPIYDNDCALGSMTSIQNKSFAEAINEIKNTRLPKLELGTYDDMARWAITPDLYNKLKGLGYVKLQRIQGLSERRTQFIEYIINTRREEILKAVASR